MNLQSPTVFHNLMVLSLLPETIWRLSALKATERTSEVWPRAKSHAGGGAGEGERTDEGASGGAGGEVPQTEGAVPRAGQSELAVRRHNDILG